MCIWNWSSLSDRVLWGRLESDSRTAQVARRETDVCVSLLVSYLYSPPLIKCHWASCLWHHSGRVRRERETKCHSAHFTAPEWCVAVWMHGACVFVCKSSHGSESIFFKLWIQLFLRIFCVDVFEFGPQLKDVQFTLIWNRTKLVNTHIQEACLAFLLEK